MSGGLLQTPNAGAYACVLADPPWSFLTYTGKSTTPHRCAEDHYNTMSLADLRGLPVAKIVAKDCALFMWVVGSHFDAAISLGEAWGFSVKTDAFIWIKEAGVSTTARWASSHHDQLTASAWAIGRVNKPRPACFSHGESQSAFQKALGRSSLRPGGNIPESRTNSTIALKL